MIPGKTGGVSRLRTDHCSENCCSDDRHCKQRTERIYAKAHPVQQQVGLSGACGKGTAGLCFVLVFDCSCRFCLLLFLLLLVASQKTLYLAILPAAG